MTPLSTKSLGGQRLVILTLLLISFVVALVELYLDLPETPSMPPVRYALRTTAIGFVTAALLLVFLRFKGGRCFLFYLAGACVTLIGSQILDADPVQTKIAESTGLSDPQYKNLIERPMRLLAIYFVLAGLVTQVTETTRRRNETIAARDQLRQLASKLNRSKEEESNRIARELHDQLGQSLAGIKFRMDSLLNNLDPAAHLKLIAELKDLTQQLNTTIRTTRELCGQLRPRILDELGLAKAVEWEVREFEFNSGIGCQLNIGSNHWNEPKETATALYRILQEILRNIARHAQASKVAVSVDSNGTEIRMRVADDGRGFDVEKVPLTSHGLLNISERSLAVEGRVEIDSQPGKGTTITTVVPIAANHRGSTVKRA